MFYKLKFNSVFNFLFLSCLVVVLHFISEVSGLNASMYTSFKLMLALFLFYLISMRLSKKQLNKFKLCDNTVNFFKYFIWVQAGLVIYSYFEPIFPRYIGLLLGFTISPEHEFLFNRLPFDPLKRAFSIFDNPNVAAKLLIISFISYLSLINLERRFGLLDKNLCITVFIAVLATGSRAAILVYIIGLLVYSAKYWSFKSIIKALILVFLVLGVLIEYTEVLNFNFRALSFEMGDDSLATKMIIFSEVTEGQRNVGNILDSDVSMILHYYGFLGLIVLTLVISVYCMKFTSIFSLSLLYALSGSLFFSMPNIALLLTVYCLILLSTKTHPRAKIAVMQPTNLLILDSHRHAH